MAELPHGVRPVSLREETIRMVRSVLIPFKKGVVLHEFLKTFKNLNGKDLPYAAMGHTHPLTFLKALPEAVSVVDLPSRDVILLPVASEQTAHLRKLVVGQGDSKSSSSRTLNYALRRQSPFVKSCLNEMAKTVAVAPSSSQTQATARPPTMNPRPVTKHSQSMDSRTLRTTAVADQSVRSQRYAPKDTTTTPSPEPTVAKKAPEYSSTPVRDTTPLRMLTKEEFKSEILAILKLFPNGIRVTDVDGEIRRRGLEKPANCTSLPEFFSMHPEDFRLVNDGRELYALRRHPAKATQERRAEPAPSESALPMESRGKSPMDKLKSELYELLQIYPKGLWCYALANCYREKYRKELNSVSYGFRNITELVSSMPDVITMVRPAELSDFLLYEKTLAPRPGHQEILDEAECRKPKSIPTVPYHVKDTFRRMLRFFHNGIQYSKFKAAYKGFSGEEFDPSRYGFKDDYSFLAAIKGEVVDLVNSPGKGPMIIPARNCKLDSVGAPLPDRLMDAHYVLRRDVAHQGDVLPVAALEENFENGIEWFPIKLGEIYTPTYFWFYLEKYDDDLAQQDSNMTDFYSRQARADYKIPFEGLSEGLLVAARYSDGIWYRCMVKDLKTFGCVELLCVDYGTPISVSVAEVYGLHRQFLSFPVVCMRGALDNLKPLPPATTFPKAAVKRFMELVFNKSMASNVVHVKENKDGDKVCHLILCDTNGKDDIFVIDTLCNEQLACAPDPNIQEVAPTPYVSPSSSLGTYSSVSSNRTGEIAGATAAMFNVPKPEAAPAQTTCGLNSRLSEDILLKALENLTVAQGVPDASLPSFASGLSLSTLSALTNTPSQAQLDAALTQLMQQNCYIMQSMPGNPLLNNFATGMGNNPVALTPELLQMYATLIAQSNPNVTQSQGVNLNNVGLHPTFQPPSPKVGCTVKPQQTNIFPEKAAHGAMTDSGVGADLESSESDDDISWLGIIRNVKPVELVPGIKIHIINLRNMAYLTSAEFSHLIPRFGKKDLVQATLRSKRVESDTFVAERHMHAFLFEELEKYGVPGLKDWQGNPTDTLVLYEMSKLPQLLTVICSNVHKDALLMSIWRALQHEVQSFSPDDPYWNECKR